MSDASTARCFAFSLAVATVAAVDWTYEVMRRVLTELPDGAVLAIGILYPEQPTRILAVVLGFAMPVAACRLGARVPGSALAKVVFAVAAGTAVALAVRWRGFSYYEPNSAFLSWLLGLTALLVAAAGLAAMTKAVRSGERSRAPLNG